MDDPARDLPPRVVLFDGVCAVCDAGMTWIMDHDPDRDRGGRFHYAPLQGETAQEILARHPELPDDLDSLVYVVQSPEGERVSWWSDAVFDIASDLGRPWSWLGALRWVPRPLRDLGYRAFAAVRYRIFGQLDHCRLPSGDEAALMLP